MSPGTGLDVAGFEMLGAGHSSRRCLGWRGLGSDWDWFGLPSPCAVGCVAGFMRCAIKPQAGGGLFCDQIYLWLTGCQGGTLWRFYSSHRGYEEAAQADGATAVNMDLVERCRRWTGRRLERMRQRTGPNAAGLRRLLGPRRVGSAERGWGGVGPSAGEVARPQGIAERRRCTDLPIGMGKSRST